MMNKKPKSYNEVFKENQEKLRKSAEEIIKDGPMDVEPQNSENPDKILEDDKDNEPDQLKQSAVKAPITRLKK